MAEESNGGIEEASQVTKRAISVVRDLIEVAGSNADTREAGQQLGKAALTIAQTINTCLLPLAAVNFAVEKARAYFSKEFREQLAEKAKAIPPENLVEPKASIAGPALQGLAFTYEEPPLREMYLNLLRSAMDSRTASAAHPAFVEVIKQLTAQEAELLRHTLNGPIPLVQLRVSSQTRGFTVELRHLASLEEEDKPSLLPEFPAMVDNWVRLGLVEVSYDTHLAQEGHYSWVDNRPQVVDFKAKYSGSTEQRAEVKRGRMRPTSFGRMFASACDIKEST
jgi:hypothetical protein